MSSFLNSVLNTLDNKTAVLAKPSVRAPTVPPQPSNGKRKAESQLSRPDDKALKTATTITPWIINGTSPLTNSIRTTTSKPTPTVDTPTSVSSPYRGTGKPSPTVIALSATEPKAPPKKGSYAEIMARARQATIAAPVGTITHKPKEKLSAKKELALAMEMAKGKKMVSKNGAKDSQRNGSRAPGSKQGNGESKNAEKSAKPPGYSGTAKPKVTPSYKGTMKPGSSSMKSAHRNNEADRHKASASHRKEYYSNEESEEDEDGYASISDEFSDDMDAGFGDVEEEDERAAREAKKEDNYEKKMLDELKRQKEAKRKRLEELATRQKPQRY